MTTGPSRLPALRVKLPCDDEKDFFARFADSVAEKGLRVPTANLRPVGSRVRVVLEFRNAETVSGEAVVDAHVEGPRPTMNVRLLKFERSRPAAAPAPAAAPPATPTATATATGTAAAVPTATATPPAKAAPPAKAPSRPTQETSFESLFEEEKAAEPPAPDPVPLPRPPAEGTEELEPLYDEPARTAEPTPEPRPMIAEPGAAAIPAASRRTAMVAMAAGVALVLGILGYVVVRRPPRPPPGPAPAASASAADDAALAGRVATADRRISDGRLTGPDGALDHLLAAQALRPDDPRVKERLGLLADTLEKLGGRALDRGDVAEAEVHLAAALQAAPDRQSISAKLEALAKLPQSREARAGPARGAGEGEPAR